MKRLMLVVAAMLLGAIVPGLAKAEPFEIKATDRVVLIGSTLIEREQRYGYWEAALTAKFPGLTLRNLAWSGDTVDGIARRAFEHNNADIGRKRLVELALAEKPSVIVICYGANEAYEGESGLKAFVANYEKLLDQLAPAKARVVLMSPLPLEDKGPPLPNPEAQNKRLASYRDAIAALAKKRQVVFADMFEKCGGVKGLGKDLTDNGMHLTEEGFRKTVPQLWEALGHPRDDYSPKDDALREAIIKKNELYFHRWRPQNETYLFGFRKHEQGRNAKEIVEFDPLIADAEKEIMKLLKR